MSEKKDQNSLPLHADALPERPLAGSDALAETPWAPAYAQNSQCGFIVPLLSSKLLFYWQGGKDNNGPLTLSDNILEPGSFSCS